MRTSLYLEIYRIGHDDYAQYIDVDYFVGLKEQYGRCFTLPGEGITQFFVTVDNAIRDTDALALIERIEKGRVVQIHIDLSTMTVTRYNENDEREC